MGLREHEERALAQIQKHLANDDPRFTSRFTRTQPVLRIPKPVLFGIALLSTYALGLLGIVAGVILSSAFLTVLGAAITAAFPTVVAARAWRERPR